MKVHYPKLYNMAHLSLNVFTAYKGSTVAIIFYLCQTLKVLNISGHCLALDVLDVKECA